MARLSDQEVLSFLTSDIPPPLVCIFLLTHILHYRELHFRKKVNINNSHCDSSKSLGKWFGFLSVPGTKCDSWISISMNVFVASFFLCVCRLCLSPLVKCQSSPSTPRLLTRVLSPPINLPVKV